MQTTPCQTSLELRVPFYCTPQASSGVSLVLCLIGTCVSVTVSCAQGGPAASPLVVAVLIEAVVALACLAYLMWGDPGVVHRSQHTCMPVPTEVADKLSEAATRPGFTPAGPTDPSWNPLAGMTNLHEGERSYCVRCCLWRDQWEPPPRGRISAACSRSRARIQVHHCSTCQRCVKHFDHHVRAIRISFELSPSRLVRRIVPSCSPLASLCAHTVRRLWPVHRWNVAHGQHARLLPDHPDGVRGHTDHCLGGHRWDDLRHDLSRLSSCVLDGYMGTS